MEKDVPPYSYKPGDLVRITSKSGSHQFDIGDVCELTEYAVIHDAWRVENAESGVWFYVPESDFEPYKLATTSADGKMTLEEAVKDAVDQGEQPINTYTRDLALRIVSHDLKNRTAEAARLMEIEQAIHLGMGIVMQAVNIGQLSLSPDAMVKFNTEHMVVGFDMADGNTVVSVHKRVN